MANLLLFVNNATSALLGNVGPTDTTIALLNGDGAKFPAPSTGFSFLLTIEDTAGNVEVVEVTGRSSDILTVVRGREGTAARAFTAGATAEARVTAGMLAYLDWQTPKNTANGPLVLDGDAKAPVSTIDTPVRTIADAVYEPKIGFTPVQQNGGTGMLSNKIRVGWDGNFLLAQVDSTSYQVPIRTSAGTILQLTNNPRCRIVSQTSEDDLCLGPNGWYVYANGTDAFGLYHATKGGAFAVSDADKSINFAGAVKQGGVQVALVGHTHTIANIAGLQDALNAKFNSTGGNISGNMSVSGTLTAGAISSPSITDTSDARYKNNVTPMSFEDAEAIVRGTVGVRYFNTLTNQADLGVIAQTQMLVTPELVPKGADGMYSVAYQRLVAPLAVVSQNLLSRMSVLEAKVNGAAG